MDERDINMNLTEDNYSWQPSKTLSTGGGKKQHQNKGDASQHENRTPEASGARITPGIEDIALRIISVEGNRIALHALVDEIAAELSYPKDRVLQRLMKMQQENRISLEEEQPHSTLSSYAFSPNALWFWGTVLATMLSLSLLSVTSGLALYLRYVFGGLLILFLPGYSLIEFLYAKKRDLEDLTRIALSIGLSLAIVPLVGLILNYTPFGIRLLPVALSLGGLTILLSLIGLRKKHAYYKLVKNIT